MQSTSISIEEVTDVLLSSDNVRMVDQSKISITYNIERNGKELILINTPYENYLIQ